MESVPETIDLVQERCQEEEVGLCFLRGEGDVGEKLWGEEALASLAEDPNSILSTPTVT